MPARASRSRALQRDRGRAWPAGSSGARAFRRARGRAAPSPRRRAPRTARRGSRARACAAEREPLELPSRECRGALSSLLPEPEALEQHPDPLAPLGHVVEPPVEVEVLERGQLTVDERLVPQEADQSALRFDL